MKSDVDQEILESKKRELELSIDSCKELILQNFQNNDEDAQQKNTLLVKELIELRKNLHELREGDDLDTGNIRCCGHKFLVKNRRESLVAANRFCDKCGQIIWSILQPFYQCKYCGYYCHPKCLGVVTRTCAYVKANEETTYELTICPEKGLGDQKYRCADCKTKLNIDPDDMQFANPRICDYDGRYYCPVCHWGDTAVIPARVIRNWDFELKYVRKTKLPVI
uniref:Phorbol-ester/DAG-type domain-containing protein n=1 Tax=Romanomermis culicivorax TaxID=13658 RepID=A0A915KNQ4_ROMCU